MVPFRRRLLAEVFKGFDTIALATAFGFASVVATQASEPFSPNRLTTIRLSLYQVLLLILTLVALRSLLTGFGLYRSRRLDKRLTELWDVIKATAVVTALVAICVAVVEPALFNLRFVAALWFCGTTIMLTSRIVLRWVLDRIRVAGRNHRHILVVGSNSRAIAMANRMVAERELGYELVGFIDDPWNGGPPTSHGPPLLGELGDLPTLLERGLIDEVVVCLPIRSFYDTVLKIKGTCEEQGLVVRVLSDLVDFRGTGSDDERDLGLLRTLNSGPLDGFPAMVKRALDVSISLMMLAVSAPLWILVALAIRLDSPGPIMFRQVRRGLNRRPFTMLKFRTMVADAETRFAEVVHLNEAGGPSFKIRDDPRITRVGRWLRKLSLDELPQLLCILRGDMSLVGPRPLFDWEYDRIEHSWIKRRCSVRPGLTGLWQISGRSDLPFEKRIQLDLDYIDNWSLRQDLAILARTLPVVLQGRGAA